MQIGRGVEREARGMPGGHNSEANLHPAVDFCVVSAGGLQGLYIFKKKWKFIHFSSRKCHPDEFFFWDLMKMQFGAGCMKMQKNFTRDAR